MHLFSKNFIHFLHHFVVRDEGKKNFKFKICVLYKEGIIIINVLPVIPVWVISSSVLPAKTNSEILPSPIAKFQLGIVRLELNNRQIGNKR